MLGAIAGALPDILTWSRYMETDAEIRRRLAVSRWAFWWTYHEGPGLDLWRWTGVAYLHVLTDQLVHPFDGTFKSYLRWVLLEASLWMPTLALHVLIWTW